ncbi:MAG: dihydrolipoamide acetyltransferase component of pyruvate dehydrogenase complex [Meiothermus sp.]|uniref:2-oxo acid dehydrogenase subunit E2 n=1 Tax=Meiothermus sp. TaxID=1955249 RepID=UPI0021DDEAD9|nr:2-oxo acid dehydrogenase subunit E2 [Meiothermus sp.]GIW29028.1 MAG: dihydrolipoamide acetyltransferase component of pyruvate dehydrogenase complex [Meiothermus sp.]GIW29083.1 MAG: dihydrolipoamide acetyltransferase component of pyruvate dehydrogenase complex [Meiothermus sp.]
MAELKLPDLGDNVTSAVVVGVLIKEGDTIAAGQPVLELETDKAVMEAPASEGGTVSKVLVKPGDEVKSGQVIAVLGDAASSAEKQELKKEPERKEEKAAPAPAPSPAPAATPSAPAAAPRPPVPPAPAGQRRLIPAAPSVRRLAREMGINLLEVVGSGPAYRISENDLKRFAAGEAPAVSAPQPSSTPAPALPDFSKFGPVRREAMSGVRRATVRSMAQAWSTIPMVTQFDKADITEMEALRKRMAPRAEQRGAKVTMTAILLKIAAAALKQFPKFNASIDTATNEIIYKDYIHIGVAVDTPTGLLVPVVRDVDKKGVIALAKELGEIAAKARDRKLTPEEMQGATFTISNLGGIGGTGFTPIVNWPEVAIMGVSRSSMEPVWNAEKGTFEPRNMMPFSLSYDHRLIDGADAARFCRFVAELLEDPFLLGFEG